MELRGFEGVSALPPSALGHPSVVLLVGNS